MGQEVVESGGFQELDRSNQTQVLPGYNVKQDVSKSWFRDFFWSGEVDKFQADPKKPPMQILCLLFSH